MMNIGMKRVKKEDKKYLSVSNWNEVDRKFVIALMGVLLWSLEWEKKGKKEGVKEGKKEGRKWKRDLIWNLVLRI